MFPLRSKKEWLILAVAALCLIPDSYASAAAGNNGAAGASYVAEGMNALATGDSPDAFGGQLVGYGLETLEHAWASANFGRSRRGGLRLTETKFPGTVLKEFEKNFGITGEDFLLRASNTRLTVADLEEIASGKIASGKIGAAVQAGRQANEEEKARALQAAKSNILVGPKPASVENEGPDLFETIHRSYINRIEARTAH
jgi:hypothetical protein